MKINHWPTRQTWKLFINESPSAWKSDFTLNVSHRTPFIACGRWAMSSTGGGSALQSPAKALGWRSGDPVQTWKPRGVWGRGILSLRNKMNWPCLDSDLTMAFLGWYSMPREENRRSCTFCKWSLLLWVPFAKSKLKKNLLHKDMYRTPSPNAFTF